MIYGDIEWNHSRYILISILLDEANYVIYESVDKKTFGLTLPFSTFPSRFRHLLFSYEMNLDILHGMNRQDIPNKK